MSTVTLKDVFKSLPEPFILWLDRQVPRDPYRTDPHDHAYYAGASALKNKIIDLYANSVNNKWVEPTRDAVGSDTFNLNTKD